MVAKMTRDEAVAYAVAELRSHKNAWWNAESEATAGWGGGQNIHAWKVQGLAAGSGYRPTNDASPFSLEKFDKLLEKSKGDHVAFDAIGLIAADYLQRRQPMPDPLLEWTIAVHQRRIERPLKKQGKIRERYFLRDVHVYRLVQELVLAGFNPTRNEKGQHTDSACDIVEDAMKLTYDKKDRLSYASIKKLWHRLKGGATETDCVSDNRS